MKKIEIMATSLLKHHDLWRKGWRFKWTRHKTKLGCTLFHKKLICLSKLFVENNLLTMEEITDTLKHEVAHALAGYEAGHGPKWEQACNVVGVLPTPCSTTSFPGKYSARCYQCNKVYYRHQKCKNGYAYYCPKCPTNLSLPLLFKENHHGRTKSNSSG